MILLLVYSWADAREIVVELSTPSRAELSRAVDLGFSIDDLSHGIARGIVTEEALARLKQAGLDVRIVADDVRDLLPSLKLPHRGEYHDYGELTADFQTLAATYPDICRLHNLGTSVQGRTIWGLEITDNPDSNELEPEVRLIGCHHGNEPISVEVPLDICHHLLENYTSDPDVAELVNEREIWIIPMMNPDGLEAGSRANANGVDLNRNYAYMRETGSLSGSYSQPETKAVRDNALCHNFCLSLTYHSGAEYVNYLWNYTPNDTPDNDYIVTLSLAYDSYVNYGVTEGYDWYQTKGDCNDWSYGTYGGMDWTIELSNGYAPPESQIDGILNDNRPAVIDFFQRAIQGIGGTVTDASTGDPVEAMINIQSLDWPVFNQLPMGDYHRPLPTGTYTVIVSSPGYETATISDVSVISDQRTELDVTLTQSTDQRNYARRVVGANSTNYNGNYPYPTHGHDALGTPDEEWFSLGKNGWIVFDMGENSPVIDGPGDDITIYEAGTDGDEGFELYLGENFNGPWTEIGSGNGTTAFDLQGTGMTEARYVCIRDDDVGSSSIPNPGFDLDAVESGEAPMEPYLVLLETSVQDPDPANGNGRLDPGENALFFVTLKNTWAGEATAVAGSLFTTDPYVTVTTATTSYPDIPGGSSTTNQTGFGVFALESCPKAHIADLTLAVAAAGGYHWSIPVNLMVGQHELLFVDSDNENTEERIVTALEAWGGMYTRLDVYNQETVPLDTLLSYRTVLWSAGDQNASSLTDANQANMASYLDQEGSLLFTAENYLSAYGGNSFTSDYLHVSSYETSISGTVVNGIAEDPIGDGVTVTLSYPLGLAEYPDRVSPDTQAAEVFRMQGSNNPVALRYPGTGGRGYRVIFFGAPLEAFPISGADPHNIQTVVARCLTWLGSIDDLFAPTTPSDLVMSTDGTLTWSASTDNIGIDHYRIYRDTSAYFAIQGLTPHTSTTSTTVSLPGSVGDPATNYFFRVTAVDAATNESFPSVTVGEFDISSQRGQQ